jgi:ABC-type taurine transport system substrate-binding protein
VLCAACNRGRIDHSTGESMKRVLGLLTAVALALGATAAWAQKTVTFAYQDMMNPWRWVQQTGEIEKATGFKINYRQFGGGGDVIRAMASGDVQLGEVGSTGIATAISQGMDVELFWILEDIAAAVMPAEPTSPILTSPEAIARITSPPPPNMRQLIL